MSATLRNECESVIKYQDIPTPACLDDKHKTNAGEPGFTVAVVERGNRVMEKFGAPFKVGDHEFTNRDYCFMVLW